MPEGPSLIMFREEMLPFKGKKVLEATGSAKTITPADFKSQVLVDINTWGKHLLLSFSNNLTIRVHFLMFGTFRINDTKDAIPRLHLRFTGKEELNLYNCSLRLIEKPLDEVYDWSGDIMNPHWDEKAALRKLKEQPADRLICDILLDQNIFAGLGNIIKNEVLFLTHVQPESEIGAIPANKRRELIRTSVSYAQDFLKWRREGVLKKHWQAHNKRICPRDDVPFHKAHLGQGKRRSFWCDVCQKLYTNSVSPETDNG